MIAIKAFEKPVILLMGGHEKNLDLKDVKVISISLVCQKEALEKRIQKDINQGIRKPDVLARSVERLEMYQKLNTYKIDVSNKTIEEVVKEIIKVGDEND